MSKKAKENKSHDIDNKDISTENVDTAVTEDAANAVEQEEELPVEEVDQTDSRS